MRLKNRVALITGANDGIGRATAEAFVREGASVIITGRRSDLGLQAEKRLGLLATNPQSTMFIQGEISKDGDNQRVVDRVIEAFGRLNIVVNCAAMQLGGTVLESTAEDYDRIFSVNVKGIGLMAKRAIPHLQKSKCAAKVNIASLNGNIGIANRTLYGASKAAVIVMTQSMAADFPQIRINAISPGFTKSRQMIAGPVYRRKRDNN